MSVASRGSRVKALDTRTYPRELYPLKTQSRPKYLYLRCLYCATHALCSVRTVLRLCYGMLVLCCDIAAVTGPVLFPYLAPVQTKGGGLVLLLWYKCLSKGTSAGTKQEYVCTSSESQRCLQSRLTCWERCSRRLDLRYPPKSNTEISGTDCKEILKSRN